MRQLADFDNATRCYLCRHEFKKDDLKGPKISDHYHITGEFIGAAHRHCNLQRPVSFQIPVFFHNFRIYNAHLIVYKFGKRSDREIKAIGQYMEKYLQVQWEDYMVFRDSLKFIFASLDQLIASLAKTGPDKFITLHKVVANMCANNVVALLEIKSVLLRPYRLI